MGCGHWSGRPRGSTYEMSGVEIPLGRQGQTGVQIDARDEPQLGARLPGGEGPILGEEVEAAAVQRGLDPQGPARELTEEGRHPDRSQRDVAPGWTTADGGRHALDELLDGRVAGPRQNIGVPARRGCLAAHDDAVDEVV